MSSGAFLNHSFILKVAILFAKNVQIAAPHSSTCMCKIVKLNLNTQLNAMLHSTTANWSISIVYIWLNILRHTEDWKTDAGKNFKCWHMSHQGWLLLGSKVFNGQEVLRKLQHCSVVNYWVWPMLLRTKVAGQHSRGGLISDGSDDLRKKLNDELNVVGALFQQHANVADSNHAMQKLY